MRSLLTFFLLIFILNSFAAAISWQEYKDKYLREGRYIADPYNNNRVTSESQGYGLILAVKFNDRETFDSIYKWTKRNLQREDKLFSWLWNKNVIDKNNAADGDLLISYALLVAYEKWADESYLKEFQSINNSLKRLIVNIDISNRIDSLLLPAIYGFSNERYEITIYPSYYIDFILKKLAKVDKEWIPVYKFVDRLYRTKNLTTQIIYSLTEKKIKTKEFSDMDVYRVILYSYIAGRNLSIFKESFQEIDDFFKKNNYIPLKFIYGNLQQEKDSSPFCVYKIFYLLYNDEKYIQKYYFLKETDKQNYFCDSLDLLIPGESK